MRQRQSSFFDPARSNFVCVRDCGQVGLQRQIFLLYQYLTMDSQSSLIRGAVSLALQDARGEAVSMADMMVLLRQRAAAARSRPPSFARLAFFERCRPWWYFLFCFGILL